MFKDFLMSGIVLLFFFLGYAQAEEITLTTYYPSPYGSYNNLTVNGQLKIKGTLTNGTAVETNFSHGGTWGWFNIENPYGLQLLDTGGGLATIRVRDVRFETVTTEDSSHGVSYCVDISNGVTTKCDQGYVAVACGKDSCTETNLRKLKNPENCPEGTAADPGWMICLKAERTN